MDRYAEVADWDLSTRKAHMFSNDPISANPWNPDWATHKASDLATAAGVNLNIKGLRRYTASQLLAARFDCATLRRGSAMAALTACSADGTTN